MLKILPGIPVGSEVRKSGPGIPAGFEGRMIGPVTLENSVRREEPANLEGSG